MGTKVGAGRLQLIQAVLGGLLILLSCDKLSDNTSPGNSPSDSDPTGESILSEGKPFQPVVGRWSRSVASATVPPVYRQTGGCTETLPLPAPSDFAELNVIDRGLVTPPALSLYSDVTMSAQGESGAGVTTSIQGTRGGESGSTGSQPNRTLEEPDLFSQSESDVFLLNKYKGLQIVEAREDAAPALLASVYIPGVPLELFRIGDRAFVVSGGYVLSEPPDRMRYLPMRAEEPGSLTDDPSLKEMTRSRVFEVDLSKAKILFEAPIEGTLVESRKLGDFLYVVSAGTDKLIVQSLNAAGGLAEAGRVEIPRPPDLPNGKGTAPDVLPAVYFSELFTVVAQPRRKESTTGSGGYSLLTDLHFIDTTDPSGALRRRGSLSIDGVVMDRFKMDLAGSVFRVVSAEPAWSVRSGSSANNRLLTIDLSNPDAPAILGQLSSIGRNEQLYATRFDGSLLYLVTFRRTDPLWLIDLAAPAKPAILSELIVPGWSEYLEPVGPKLFALGTENNRVTVSQFDVSNPKAPRLVSRVYASESGRSSSFAFQDFKAFQRLADLDLLLVPFRGSLDGRDETDAVRLVDTKAGILELKGALEHDGLVRRAFERAGKIFAFSTRELSVTDISNRDAPAVSHRLNLLRPAESVLAFGDQRAWVRVASDEYELVDLSTGNSLARIVLDSGDQIIADPPYLYVFPSIFQSYYYYGVRAGSGPKTNLRALRFSPEGVLDAAACKVIDASATRFSFLVPAGAGRFLMLLETYTANTGYRPALVLADASALPALQAVWRTQLPMGDLGYPVGWEPGRAYLSLVGGKNWLLTLDVADPERVKAVKLNVRGNPLLVRNSGRHIFEFDYSPPGGTAILRGLRFEGGKVTQEKSVPIVVPSDLAIVDGDFFMASGYKYMPSTDPLNRVAYSSEREQLVRLLPLEQMGTIWEREATGTVVGLAGGLLFEEAAQAEDPSSNRLCALRMLAGSQCATSGEESNDVTAIKVSHFRDGKFEFEAMLPRTTNSPVFPDGPIILAPRRSSTSALDWVGGDFSDSAPPVQVGNTVLLPGGQFGLWALATAP